MKAMSVGKVSSFLVVSAIVLCAAAMWSAGQSVAAVPASINAKSTESNSVQDIYDDQGLRMKLIVHRPGHALVPVVTADRSC